MPDTEKKGFWAHPLVILLMGTALSALLIPHISEQVDHNKVINEARLKKAMEILSDSADTERNLNQLSATLGIFEKDSRGPAARFISIEKNQSELRTQMMEKYLAFDKQAWWWAGQIHIEAKILEIASHEELDRLDQISKQYSESLEKSTVVVDAMWDTFLRAKYKPDAPGNEELLNLSQAKLLALKDVRTRLVMESAQILAKKKESFLSRWTWGLL